MEYQFLSGKPWDLFSILPLPNIYLAWTNRADNIFFAFANQNAHYNKKHQFFLMKVGDWAMLRLHKGYFMFFFAEITKKLRQQYMGPFQIKEKLGYFFYQQKVPNNSKIDPILLVVQLEPITEPSWDFFQQPHPNQLFSVFVDGDTYNLKLFEIVCLLNKQISKKRKSPAIKYLVYQISYGPE